MSDEKDIVEDKAAAGPLIITFIGKFTGYKEVKELACSSRRIWEYRKTW